METGQGRLTTQADIWSTDNKDPSELSGGAKKTQTPH